MKVRHTLKHHIHLETAMAFVSNVCVLQGELRLVPTGVHAPLYETRLAQKPRYDETCLEQELRNDARASRHAPSARNDAHADRHTPSARTGDPPSRTYAEAARHAHSAMTSASPPRTYAPSSRLAPSARTGALPPQKYDQASRHAPSARTGALSPCTYAHSRVQTCV